MHFLHLLEQSGNFHLLKMGFRPSGFDPREIENIVDQLQQQVAVFANDIQVFLPMRIAVVGGEQLRKPDDRIQRSPYFVAHGGQKNRFQPVGLHRFFLRDDQFLGVPDAVAHVVDQREHPVPFKRGAPENSAVRPCPADIRSL